MEQILVTMDARPVAELPFRLSGQEMVAGFLEALYRAIHLAARIKASVHILLVSNLQSHASRSDILTVLEETARSQLELMTEKARSEGVAIHFYVALGNYEDEVIRFVQENRITLLVLGFPKGVSESVDTGGEFVRSINRIRQAVSCTIEMVRQRESRTLKRDFQERLDKRI